MELGRVTQFLALALLSPLASGQSDVPWRFTPNVVVIGASAEDPRFALADEAVDFWNRTLSELGSGFRIGPVTRLRLTPNERVLQAVSERLVSGAMPRLVDEDELAKVSGDLVVVLGDSGFVSFTARLDQSFRPFIGIREMRTPPLSLPNVARNVIAHELGHAIGLGHNGDSKALMCGRPAECRPDVFQSDEPRMFPLLEYERRNLLLLYPRTWTSVRPRQQGTP